MSFLRHYDHLRIEMKDILSATNNFDSAKVIGSGGFGRVYKGELSLPEGPIMVAFKRLDRRLGQGNIEFWKEVMMLSKYKHENLVSLMYYCIERDEMILGYEYVSRGSLDRYLSDASLTWTRRLKISVGAARGLNHLHDPRGAQERLIHRDIKSGNILLDESWMAKVSDFGLSKAGPANQAQSVLASYAVGTPGYCDPVYLEMGFLSKESDVYSFGVVLFEILCGRLCYEYNRGKLINIIVPEWRRCYEEKALDQIIFPGLKEQMDLGSLNTFSAIAYQCVKKAREDRPTMAEVVKKLEFALQQQVTQKSNQDDSEDLGKGMDFETLVKIANDCKTHKVVVKGDKVDPMKVHERVQKENHRKVEILSPVLKPSAKDEAKKSKKEKPPKRVEIKDELLPVITVVVKLHMHCEACAQEIRKRILRMKGVESAVPNLKSSQMTVKGTFQATELLDYVYKLIEQHAIIVKQDLDPEKEEVNDAKDEKKNGNNDEKKDEKLCDEGGDKQDPDPKEEEDYNAKDEKKDGSNDEKKDEKFRDEGVDKQEPTDKPEDIAMRKNEYNYNNYHQHKYDHHFHFLPSPVMFSDENPNACNVM